MKVVSVKLYRTETNAFLESGAVPNVMKSDTAARLSLMPDHTSTKITAANGQKTICRGALKSIPVTFGQSEAKLNFLVVDGFPVDLLVGYPTMEELQACLDLGNQSVRLVVDRKKETMRLPCERPQSTVLNWDTDSKDFTSQSGTLAEGKDFFS